MLQSLNVEASGLSELDPLQQKLVQKLKGQERLLLVLDDVWEADNLNIHSWNLLIAPLCNRSADAKIIMTTRTRKVSEMVPISSTYDLGFLSDEDTLELLDTITLVSCGKWISLPPLGQLPSLRSLYVSGACAVEYIGSEFFSGGFPQLEKLTLGKMDNWKSWCGAQEGECPKLKKLSIESSPNLESLSLINLGALEDISISWCARLPYMSGNFLELLHLQHAQTIKISKNFKVWCIQRAPPLDDKTHLYLEDVGQPVAEHVLGMFSHICRLTVKRCRNLTSLPLGNQSALESVEISDCRKLRITSVSPQLWQLPSLQRINLHRIHGAESIKIVRESYAEFTNVDQRVASFLLKELSRMIRRLIIIRCTNLTSLPWTELTTLQYLRIRDCPWFRLPDAEQFPPTLQVLCIYGNACEREQCSRHQHFQRLKQVQQCSYKKGGDCNLYLVFRNVHDASETADFCSKICMEIHTLEIEWDCCTNGRFIVVDSVAEEVLGKLYHPLGEFWYKIRSLNKLVIRGYTGSSFASSLWDRRRLHSLYSVTLQQCSKCEILRPLSQLSSLKELLVEGPSSLESFTQDYDISERGWQKTQTRIAFPSLQKLEVHNMPVWKKWLGTKEGDFPRLRKLVLKHCPKLRALPRLPPRLKELELEACAELASLSIFDFPDNAKLPLSATKGTPPILRHMSLTNCPLLIALCEGNPRILAGIPNILIDGVRHRSALWKKLLACNVLCSSELQSLCTKRLLLRLFPSNMVESLLSFSVDARKSLSIHYLY
ncbi:hypothetical protein Taro_048351 [Colocasia esculenta]|uniref:NB-ARC domain-containing protein n=1 Tax=Colocasia esculenta TaxID=4460 RepID=A0A843X2P7_COLES|nr:hypothetical protein [Colocasia esculenta]